MWTDSSCLVILFDFEGIDLVRSGLPYRFLGAFSILLYPLTRLSPRLWLLCPCTICTVLPFRLHPSYLDQFFDSILPAFDWFFNVRSALYYHFIHYMSDDPNCLTASHISFLPGSILWLDCAPWLIYPRKICTVQLHCFDFLLLLSELSHTFLPCQLKPCYLDLPFDWTRPLPLRHCHPRSARSYYFDCIISLMSTFDFDWIDLAQPAQ